MRKAYSIFCPDFDVTSGGIRVVYALYAWLLIKGEIAFPNAKFSNSDFIAIYPEIISGNPLGANKVVRYVLQTPGVMSFYGMPGPSAEEIKATSDHVYYFSKMFAPNDVKEEQIMFLPIINLHLFKDQKKTRNKTCYLIGKGQNTNKHPQDSVLIDRRFAADQQALADLLNECQYMYCYDDLTAQLEIARLCGCKVKYLGKYTKEELSKYEPGLNGISFEIEDTPLDTEAFRNHYKDLIQIFSEKLDQFIIDTQT